MIPTLTAGAALAECVKSLDSQTFRGFEAVVVDNSGQGLVAEQRFPRVTVIEMPENVGFGAAINAAIAQTDARYVATLNDDAIASPEWLESLVAAMESNPDAGSCASQVRLYADPLLDSAGMLICADGSSKQRGHLRPPEEFPRAETVLLPSASAAIYRRSMLEETGGFDGDFFLYCEDTDLGLRAARLGWRCLYVPGAVVLHRYSHSAGRVSPLKAYYVERNRIAVAVKNFPARWLLGVPFAALVRYAWHLISLIEGRGSAGEFQRSGHGGWRLGWYIVKAHYAAVARLPRLWKQRRAIAATARISNRDFAEMLHRFSITPRQVAEF